jgi:hypothetical protein
MMWLSVVVMTLGTAACAAKYRVEPLLMEGSVMGDKVVDSHRDAKEVKEVGALVEAFLGAAEGESCSLAWPQLTTRYRERYLRAAGADGNVTDLFCRGLVLDGDVLRESSWRVRILGRRPHRIVSPPPEMPVRLGKGESLFHVIQKDGSYVSFVVLTEGPDRKIEPFDAY